MEVRKENIVVVANFLTQRDRLAARATQMMKVRTEKATVQKHHHCCELSIALFSSLPLQLINVSLS
jgi:hypothetical protein